MSALDDYRANASLSNDLTTWIVDVIHKANFWLGKLGLDGLQRAEFFRAVADDQEHRP